MVTTIIAWDIEPFIPITIGATEAHNVSIDASEGDGESKKSSSEMHGVLVILKVCQWRTGNLYLKRI